MVWLDFDPQVGHEQAGRRSALVLSPRACHQKTPFAVVCPITSRVKGYPFEVLLPPDLPVADAILADQVKSVDWRIRRIETVGRAPDHVIAEVLARIAALLGVGPQ